MAFVFVFACGDDSGVPLDAPIDPSTDRVVLDATFDTTLDTNVSDTGADTADTGGDVTSACVAMCRPDLPSDGSCDELDCVLVGREASCGYAGDLQEGSPCDAPSDCGAGLACFSRRGTGGVCGRVCCPDDATSCGEQRSCTGIGRLASGEETAFGECRVPRPCSLFNTEACELGEACYVTDDEGGTDCRPEGGVGTGGACDAPTDCRAGHDCVGAFEQTCVRVCRLDSQSECDEGESCLVSAGLPDGVGYCS